MRCDRRMSRCPAWMRNRKCLWGWTQILWHPQRSAPSASTSIWSAPAAPHACTGFAGERSAASCKHGSAIVSFGKPRLASGPSDCHWFAWISLLFLLDLKGDVKHSVVDKDDPIKI